MSNYLADNSYVAVKPESTEGTPVVPTTFIPLVGESIKTVLNLTPDRRMKGLDWKSDDVTRGIRRHEGDFVVHADPDTLGHLLNMTYAKGSTTGDAASGYTHPFTVGSPKSYTIEIKKGPYAQRYFGVKAESLKLDFVDGRMQATVAVKAMGQFSVGSLAAALTGAGMTSLVLATDYDMKPNSGLVVGDVITVGGVDITITSVNADGITVGFASISVTASVGDPVYLKAQAASFTNLKPPFYQGNALVGVGANETAATTAAGAKSTATPMYEFSVSFMNNLLDAPASGSQDPVKLLPQVREATLTVSQLFETVAQHQAWLNAAKQAITEIVKGTFIKSDFTTWEKLTLKFHKVKLTANDEPLEVGSYIFDKQAFEALYDSADAKALSIELVNRTAGTSY